MVITCNDGSSLEGCLLSLTWAHEIVVADMRSEDDSVAIAQRYASIVVGIERSSHVEMARNAAIQHTNGDWVLVVDPDERIPGALAEAILNGTHAASMEIGAIRFARRNLVFSKWARRGGWWPDWQVRLFRKDRVEWPREIHGKPQVRGITLSLPPRFELAIEHLAYDSIRAFVDKFNRYTDIQALDLLREGVNASVSRMIWRPCRVFVTRYLYHRGFLDGGYGLMLATLWAWYIFMLEAKMLTSAVSSNTVSVPKE